MKFRRKNIPTTNEILHNKEKMLHWLKQMEETYNTILENQEMYVKEHNKHDERLDIIEERLTKLKKEEK